MDVVILNWNAGENDPFTAFNAVLTRYLEDCGKTVRIVEITNEGWPNDIIHQALDGIDFVFTWQGLGSSVLAGSGQQSFWDLLRVPLITLHGDHPSHFPLNHMLDIPSCAHVYLTREFSLYASRHFRRRTRTIAIDSPLFSLDEPLALKTGDFFVLPKNILAPAEMERQWKSTFSPWQFEYYMAASETLKAEVASIDHADFHATLDEFIKAEARPEFDIKTHPEAFHQLHSQMDLYIRNLKSTLVLEQLWDVPLQIFGRGWQPFARRGNPKHQFLPARNVADNQSQYYSKFGIIDIAPSATGLHDRTCRAMKNETPFLTSGYLPDFLPNIAAYDNLFYTFAGSDLREKCEWAMTHPAEHADLAQEFSHLYQMRVRPSEFVWKLDSIARSLDRR